MKYKLKELIQEPSVSECVIVRFFFFIRFRNKISCRKHKICSISQIRSRFLSRDCNKKSVRQGVARSTIVKICLSCLRIPLSFFFSLFYWIMNERVDAVGTRWVPASLFNSPALKATFSQAAIQQQCLAQKNDRAALLAECEISSRRSSPTAVYIESFPARRNLIPKQTHEN